jgi:ATP-binding cassette subfamily B protein
MSDHSRAKKIFDFSLLKRVFQYAAPYKKRIYISVVLSILLAFIAPLRPYLIQFTLNNYIQQGVTHVIPLRDRIAEMVIYLTIIQIGLLLIETLFRFYFSFITAWLGQTVVKDLRVAVYKRVLGLIFRNSINADWYFDHQGPSMDIEAINDIFSGWFDTHHCGSLSIISVLPFMSSRIEIDIGLSGSLSFFDHRHLFFKESKAFIRTHVWRH